MTPADQEVRWHCYLALGALVAWLGLSAWWGYYPARLPGEQVGSVLAGLKDLTILSWGYVFYRNALVTVPSEKKP